MIASILQHLLALYFAIICNWQLSSSEKSLVGYSREKKFIHVFQGFYRFRFLFFSFFPPIFFDKCLITLPATQSVWLTRRPLNTMILTNFENLNSVSNIFQETHDFLVLKDPVIICI